MPTTTPNYGWSVPTSTDYVAQGAVAIETLGDSVDATLFTALGGAYPGMRLVKKQTIGSGVSSVNVTGAFSSTYDAYKIIISSGVCSVDNSSLLLRLGATTSGYIWSYGGFANGVTFGAGSTSDTSFQAVGQANTFMLTFNAELTNPNLAKYTILSAAGGYNLTNFNSRVAIAGIIPNSTQYTDFTILPASGTLTGGTIYVYGYGAS
jgi:hypothetical protein